MNKLKQIREQKGLYQRDLAKSSGVKLSKLQKLEGGFNDINKAQAITLYKLALVLGVHMEDLIDMEAFQNSED